MFRVCHIIVGLNVGGAELMLKRLIGLHQDSTTYRHTVISLTDIGAVGRQLQALGFEVHALYVQSALDIPRAMWRLVRVIRTLNPDVVQTWMYHADLIGGLSARMAGVKNVIWNIRGTYIPQEKWSRSQFVIDLCAKLSKSVPRSIVCCAEAARSVHMGMGYAAEKMVVIPNGFELTTLQPVFDRGISIRKSLNFNLDSIVIGAVGRFDPLKDYANFVQAAAQVAALRPQARFLMIGRGINTENFQLMALLDSTGYMDRFLLLGERNDVPNLMATMDVYCLSSRAEGFPNVVAEAMAMGIPCVVTDVGDAALIVQDTGKVVRPQDSTALANALLTMVDLSHEQRVALGVRARRIIEDNYSIAVVRQKYQNLYAFQDI